MRAIRRGVFAFCFFYIIFGKVLNASALQNEIRTAKCEHFWHRMTNGCSSIASHCTTMHLMNPIQMLNIPHRFVFAKTSAQTMILLCMCTLRTYAVTLATNSIPSSVAKLIDSIPLIKYDYLNGWKNALECGAEDSP